MDLEGIRQRETLCTQEEPPACTAICPMHVDARGLCTSLAKGDFNAALTLYQKAIPFPGIISRVCDEPCRAACKRREKGGSIRLRDLERAAVELGQTKHKRSFLPSREARVAVVGGGLSGLTAAVELARKGYGVTLFEEKERLGGWLCTLPEAEMPADVLQADLARLQTLNVRIHTGERVDGMNGIHRLKEDFDAVFVATGRADGFDLGPIEAMTLATCVPGVFAGGRLRQGGDSPIFAMEDGRRAAISIDRFLQGVSLTSAREREGAFETTLYTNLEGIVPEKPVEPEGTTYTSQEAIAEAGRCIQCECLECVKGCAFLAHYKSYPKRYVHEVYNNLTIVMGTRHANGMINACSLCGQCGKICPNGLNMAEVFSQARSKMVEEGKMPPSAHDFALKDLAFSNSEAYFLARHQSGCKESRYVFFPGCQLGASSPKVVQRAYADLTQRLTGGVGLMLGCCGVIADWAGRADVFEKTIAKLRSAWEELGGPQAIAGCPTCYMVLRKAIPEMRPLGIWDVLEQIGLPQGHLLGGDKHLAIQDACTTRFEEGVQGSVRRLAKAMGFELEEMPYGREKTQCCGYGGLTAYANREVAKEMAAHWQAQSQADFLAYCANCRDSVRREGKRALHLLDLAYPAGDYGADSDDRADTPGYSQRRENREKLKTTLLREVWGEDVLDPTYEIAIKLGDGLAQTLEERMILKEDIVRTVAEAEKTGGYLVDPASGLRVASLKRGAVTYWVEYRQEGEDLYVCNAYSHRMEIEV